MANRNFSLVVALAAICSCGQTIVKGTAECPAVDMTGLELCDGASADLAMYELTCKSGSVLVWFERDARYEVTAEGYKCSPYAFCEAGPKVKSYWCRRRTS